MPNKALENMAKKAGITVDKAEEYWEKAKKIALDEFGPETKEGYFPYVMGIVKQMMGVASIDTATLRSKVEARLAAYAQSK